jgi:hypothetical protein
MSLYDMRKAAIDAHEETWQLLEKPDRSPTETAAMIAAAQTSLELWEQVGTSLNAERGHWLVARVAVDAELPELALAHARRTLALTADRPTGVKDFDFAFAEEVAARAFALAGNLTEAANHYAEAKRLGEGIKDVNDREEFFRQFGRGPWFGLASA